jgi:hypothetical protein
MRLPSCALVLLAGAAACAQPALTTEQIHSIGIRCVEVAQTAQAIAAAKGAVPAELQTAAAACKPVPGAGPEQELQRLADAGATLDRLNLTPAALFDRLEQAASSLTGAPRFYVLAPLAKFAFDLGKREKAQQYARELLQMASQYPNDWNYGNAIYYGYCVLGLVAIEDGNIPLAGHYLMNAATTPGSPQLNSFGPNLALARELLQHGQFTVVAEFLEECKTFWKADHGNLDAWIALVRQGKIPEFTPNLDY